MFWLSTVLLVVLLVAVAYLLKRLRAQSNKLANLEREQADLASDWRAGSVDFHDIPESRLDPVITIKILNPAELAANESPFAGTISNFAPDIIKRKVYQRSSEILREELLRKGVQAQVRVHGLD